MHTTGRVDHRNMDWKPKRRYMYMRLSYKDTLYTHVFYNSLNFVKKNEEISRVMRENQVNVF